MQAGTICQRLVFTVRPSDELTHAARLMREKHVGYLVVVEPDRVTKCPRPVGVVTDRDIVVGVVAREIDPGAVRVGDLMTRNPVTAQETDSTEIVLQKMRRAGVRRLPIVNIRGELSGVVAIDDILAVIADDAQDVASLIRTERQAEEESRP